MDEERVKTFRVPIEVAGERADVALSHFLLSHTRSQIKRLIESKNVLVEGMPIKPSRKLDGGETVQVSMLPPEPIGVLPEDIPVNILFEDDYIVVVNKPAGMVVHPGAGVKTGTLVNALLHKCKGLSGIGGRIRPGIVHRLDKDTSGVIVIAKNEFAHNSMVNQFKLRRVEKSYVAVVEGNMKGDYGSFSSKIGRHLTNRLKMSSNTKSGKESLTLWKVMERYGYATLIQAKPKTGRTHQIRVHFAENGHPIVADKVYGRRKQNSIVIKQASKKIGRQSLHASKIGFNHPSSGEYVEFNAEIPEDILRIISFFEDREN